MTTASRIPATTYKMGGVLGDYLAAVSERWLKIAPLANPGMLEMFRLRNRKPPRDQVPWAGEFAGKYLTAAAQVLRLTGDAELRDLLDGFVGELVSLQARDGYLGPWPDERALTNQGTWDTWGHYHVMMGLMLWHDEAADLRALDCACRMADLICRKYGPRKKPRLVETGSTEMNLAPAHALCILFRKTGEKRYLDAAEGIVQQFAQRDADGNHLAGDYLEGPLGGREFFELPRPRWESLHPVMALAELYEITGEPRYRDALTSIWWSIARTDRHNNGGFSSGEKAQGDPFFGGDGERAGFASAIETCCTIAWIALSVEMLRLTGDPVVADELELSVLNSVVGMHSPSGRWATYDTPMNGEKRAGAHDIVFQARAGTPELNCCSVNAARGFGMVGDWAVMADDEGLIVNWYGPCRIETELAGGCAVTLEQDTDYPYANKVALTVTPQRQTAFALKLRIPRWSRRTRVAVNDESILGVEAGTYLVLEQRWRKGDRIEIAFDFSPHVWRGARSCAGQTSVYRGPVLLAWDPRYNEMDEADIPALDGAKLAGRKSAWKHWLPPEMLRELTAVDGRPVRLCDFGSAGDVGTSYRTWLKVDGAEGLPEHFAPSEGERMRAELGFYPIRYADYVSLRGRIRETWPTARMALEALQALQRDWPSFVASCERAREAVAADPEGDLPVAYAQALARVETADQPFLDPAFPELLAKEEAALRKQYDLA